MSTEIETRKCNTCGEEKPETNEYFNKKDRCKNGLLPSCKECEKIRVKNYTRKYKLDNLYGPVKIQPKEKKCSVCKKLLSSEFFAKDRKRKSGYRNTCDNCRKNNTLIRLYGITLKQYYEMYDAQNGRCAICGSKDTGNDIFKYFNVDHNHKTEKVRDLLCSKCNTAIGSLQDNPMIVFKAAKYLIKHKNL